MIELIQNGGVTSAKGFISGATYAGLKTAEPGVLDLGILLSETIADVAATFSTNRILSPSVTVSKRIAKKGTARGVVVNSGCANCSVGDQGIADAEELIEIAARHTLVSPDDLLVCSTGVIGVELPMALIRQNMGKISLSDSGGEDFALSILTTDTRSKAIAVSLMLDGVKVTLGGAAKGVGMIHPNMATMLGFVTTDAKVDNRFLQEALQTAVDSSFNMIDVDGDQSTNDTVIVLANGVAGGSPILGGTEAGERFQDALTYVCTELGKELVRDGEGAQRLIEVSVDGAMTVSDARTAARSIASSLLVKAMVHGKDPNWGRIVMALGKSGIVLEESKIDVFISEIHIVSQGKSIPYYKDAVISAMDGSEVGFRVNLNLGQESAIAWGCDLTEEYVIYNSAYST